MKIFFIYFVLCGTVLGEQSIEELSKILLNDFNKRANASVIVPEEVKADVIKYVRDVRDDKIYGNHVSARTLLINLNDAEYIQQLVADLEADNASTYMHAVKCLRGSAQIEVIPYISEHFYIEEGLYAEFKNNSNMYASLSAFSGFITLSILSRSPVVPSEVKAWAAGVLEEQDNSLGREMVRQWWPANKQHFETKEYHKLRPLNSTNAGEERKNATAAAAFSEVQTATNSARSTEGSVNSPAPANAAPQSSNLWKLLFPILGIGVLILAVLVSKLWKRR